MSDEELTPEQERLNRISGAVVDAAVKRMVNKL